MIIKNLKKKKKSLSAKSYQGSRALKWKETFLKALRIIFYIRHIWVLKTIRKKKAKSFAACDSNFNLFSSEDLI